MTPKMIQEILQESLCRHKFTIRCSNLWSSVKLLSVRAFNVRHLSFMTNRFLFSSLSSLTFFVDSQIITMRDYVPKIIGPESYERYIGPYRGYDPTMDPSASNVFATAAFRFGHANIPPTLKRLNESFQEHERFPHLRLHHTLFSPWRIVKEGQFSPWSCLPESTN